MNLFQPDNLVLASTSERRRALLEAAGYHFRVAEPLFEEPPTPQHAFSPAGHAESLAFFKASSISHLYTDGVILGADTIAVIGNELIGKPADRDDARRILQRLAATTHSVITGVALLRPSTGRRMLRHDVTQLRVRPLSASAIEAYLDTGAWQGKAGAYGIQDQDDPFVERIEGSFSNVVGLPMELLAKMLVDFGNGD